MTTGYIYVIKNEVGGLGGFKIGQTINPPRRFRELKLGTKSSLVGLWRSDKYASIERFLHKTFKHLRVPQSEWFALTPNVLQDVIGKLNRCSTCVELKSEYKPAQPLVLTTDVTVPSRKPEQTVHTVIHHPPVYHPPAATTYKSSLPLGDFVFGAFAGWFPGLNLLMLFTCFIGKKNLRDSAVFYGWLTGLALFVITIVANAEAKPLHTYEERPHINVSSLIK